MKLTVKVLNGQECTITTSPNSPITDVKEQIEALLSILVADQKLVFKGKSLMDDKHLEDYNLSEGSKLMLVVKKSATTTTTTTPSPVVTNKKTLSPSAALVEGRPVWAKLRTFLQRHFLEKDVDAVLKEFRTEFEMNLSSLSLDDIERLATSKLRQA